MREGERKRGKEKEREREGGGGVESEYVLYIHVYLCCSVQAKLLHVGHDGLDFSHSNIK